MRIVVVGAGGQLAADIRARLSSRDVLALSRTDLDIVDAVQVEALIADQKPDLVINCAAYNLVDKAESEPEAAFAVNAFGPRNLARTCARHDATLAHFSTDYVFGLDAQRRMPWLESDAPGPLGVYGQSKLAGEVFVRAECEKHFVLRTCGLYGHKGARGKGGNFVETMLRLASEGKPIRVVGDQRCTPSFTADVAAAAIDLIDSGIYGLYHVTNAGDCSWFELATEVFCQSGLTVDCQPIAAAEWKSAARRPPYSVLDGSKLASIVQPLPGWRDALARYLAGRS